MEAVGKLLMVVAVLLFAAGVLIYVLGRSGGGLLPGDIVIRRDNFTLVFPVVTMIVVSIVLTLVLNFFWRR